MVQNLKSLISISLVMVPLFHKLLNFLLKVSKHLLLRRILLDLKIDGVYLWQMAFFFVKVNDLKLHRFQKLLGLSFFDVVSVRNADDSVLSLVPV